MDAPICNQIIPLHPIHTLPADALGIIFNLEVAYVARRVCRRWKEIADKRIIDDINKRWWWLDCMQLKKGEIRSLVQVRGANLQRLNMWRTGFPLVKELVSLCPNLIQIAIHYYKDNLAEEFRNRSSSGTALLQDIFNFPHVTNLTALFIEHVPLLGEGVRQIVQSPFMTNLATLHLHHDEIGEMGIRYITDAAHSSKLTRLVLSENRIGYNTYPAIGLSTSLKNLKILNLNDNGRGPQQEFFASSNLANLTELEMMKNEVSFEGLRALAQSPYVTALQKLNLESNGDIKDRGAQILATSLHLRLRHLNFTNCGVKADGVRALAQSPVVGNLQCYKHQYNDFGTDSALALCQDTFIRQLQEIHLFQNTIGDQGLKAFASTAGFASLTFLDIWNNNIGDEGLIALATSQYVTQLRVFKCGQNREISILGFQKLVDSCNVRNLQEFNFYNNYKGPEFAIALAQSTQLMNLTCLDFSYNKIGILGVAALMQARCTNLMRLNLMSSGVDSHDNSASPDVIAWAKIKSRLFRNLTELKV